MYARAVRHDEHPRRRSDDPSATRLAEWASIGAACIGSLVFNLATAARFPVPWLDEVMFTDPAANLVFGRGFTSCAWPFQPCTAFWAGYPPLYPAVLSLWMRIFGFGPVAVRALDYVLIVAAVLMLWRAVARLGIVATPRGRRWLVALVLLGYGVVFCYRSARVDCLGIALAAALTLAWSIPRRAPRAVAIGALAALLPLTGLQLVVYAVLMAGLLALRRRRAVAAEVASGVAGLAAGTLALFLLYSAMGVWPSFVTATVGARSFAGRGFAATLGQYDRSLGGVYKDPSFLVLLAVAIACAVSRGRVGGSALGFALAVVAVVPATLFLSGVYPVYYSWMAYVPLAVGTCALIEAEPSARRLAVPGLVLTCAVGLPLVVAWTAVDWADRDHGRVVSALRDVVREDDRVYLDYAAYYVVKPRAAAVYTDRSLRHLTPADAAAVNVLVIVPEQLDGVVRVLGGRWAPTGVVVRSRGGRDARVSIWGPRYDLAVYRRVDESRRPVR